MPPTRPIAPPPPTVSTLQTQTLAMLNPDSLSSAEELLLSIAIQIDSAVWEFQKRGGRVNVPFFQKSLDEELLEASIIFTSSLADKADPCLHSIITYVGELSEQAEARHTPLDLGAIRLSEAARRCGMATTACPTWPQELFILDLTPLLRHVPMEYRWWLPPLPSGTTAPEDDTEMAAASDAAPDTAQPPPIVPSTPEPSTPDEDVQMSPEDGGDTPRHQTRAGKRSLACTPCRENRRECKDLPGKATACASCAAHKVKCDHPKRSGDVSPALKGKARWRTALEAVEDQRETLEMLQNDNTELQEVLYTMEQMLRDLCIKANISPPPPVQCHIPQAPPLYESPAANPSSASIESTASSASSSLHLNMLTIDNPAASTGVQPVAGPSRLGPEQMQRADNAAGLGRGVEEQLRLLPGLQVQLHHAGVLAPAVEVVQYHALFAFAMFLVCHV
ncbi:hypothetical protein EI94DRAFT_1707076 [Lactarius quietus]|nr:hypothetical protein EI94DRAFT_1707076 [Lactarius quietus]